MGFLGSKESDTVAILTAQEAAELLDYESPEDMPGKVMSIFMPAVNSSLETATGKDWGGDEVVDPAAKHVAGVLLVRWFEDPVLVGKTHDAGFIALVGQLHAKARAGVKE